MRDIAAGLLNTARMRTAALLLATGGLALSGCNQEAMISSPFERLRDAGCGFRGPNPTVSQAREEAKRYADAYPDHVTRLMKIDNAFDYAYQQLIPGAVEWLVLKSCDDPVPVNRFYGELRYKKLVVGAAILLTTSYCADVHVMGAEAWGPVDEPGAETLKHACPQYLKPN